MLYPVNGSGIQGAVAAKLYEMPDTENFTSADRKMVIESQLLITLTRSDVQALMISIPQQIASTRTESITAVTGLRAEINARDEKNDGRLRVVENFRWWLLGAVAFVGPSLSFLASWLFSKAHP